MENRTKAYLAANDGITEARAKAEAIADISAKNEDNIREKVLGDVQARRYFKLAGDLRSFYDATSAEKIVLQRETR